MKSRRCPVCKKPLTKPEWERAFKIHESQEQHLRTQKGNCRRKNANCVSGSLKPRARERRKNSDELSDFSPGEIEVSSGFVIVSGNSNEEPLRRLKVWSSKNV